MNKIWFLIVGITVVTSCAPSYQKYNRMQYRIEMKKRENLTHTNNKKRSGYFIDNQHSTNDFPTTYFQPDLSLFVIALYNSWDSLDVETQNFFNESLIKAPKKNLEKEMIKNQQDEDAKIISTWPEEKKKWFAEKFFYKDIYFRNDTLFVIK
jgi:hypothetical protein